MPATHQSSGGGWDGRDYDLRLGSLTGVNVAHGDHARRLCGVERLAGRPVRKLCLGCQGALKAGRRACEHLWERTG